MTNKLELNWYGKEKQILIEPRILIESKELSNTKHDSKTENILIHGDNLIALKALEKEYAGKVKCIYIERIMQRLIQFNDCRRSLPIAG